MSRKLVTEMLREHACLLATVGNTKTIADSFLRCQRWRIDYRSTLQKSQ
ncbi:Hypothetical protein zj316_2681 [Lactiplantibacillus plantarum ZJ316]|nr:Hypothetical protein zj316_2681 [Lactiplantibacillus plantarum ZJ316]